VTNSNLTNNAIYAIYAVSVNNPPTIIEAVNNWWGTTETAAIESLVYHYADDNQCPEVAFRPYAQAPVDIYDSIPTATDDDNLEAAPFRYELSQNYPNPFNAGTVIAYFLPRASTIEITVFDILGRPVRSLAAGHFQAGRHELYFDGAGDDGMELASGIYFYRLISDNVSETKKLVLLK
jgi:hypothetical protein